MSNIGLDHPHIEEHLGDGGLCQCPCSECTARTTKLCWCADCPCMTSDDDLHAMERVQLARRSADCHTLESE